MQFLVKMVFLMTKTRIDATFVIFLARPVKEVGHIIAQVVLQMTLLILQFLHATIAVKIINF